MSLLDYLLLFAVAVCVYLAIRTYRRGRGSCRCASGCKGSCPNCRKNDESTT